MFINFSFKKVSGGMYVHVCIRIALIYMLTLQIKDTLQLHNGFLSFYKTYSVPTHGNNK